MGIPQPPAESAPLLPQMVMLPSPSTWANTDILSEKSAGSILLRQFPYSTEELKRESLTECPLQVQVDEVIEKAEPALGSEELPNIGSAGHNAGTCRPCIFAHSRGGSCENGMNCTFCHLCEKGERKRR